MRRSALFAGVLATLGCGGQPASAPVPRTGAADPGLDSSAPSFVTPARWDFHPGPPEQVLARVRLPDGGCVLAAEGGQRWTVTPNRAPPGARSKSPAPAGACVGRASASSAIAPEEIVDIVRRSQSSWFFVGASGRIYESNEPLGPFARTIDAPEPLAKISGSGTRLFGLTLGGGVMRWDDERGWRAAPAPAGRSGPARVFDLAVMDDGHALALAFPEALFVSADGGATWAPANAPPVGAQRVGVTDGGELAAEGVLESVTWSPSRAPAFARAAQRVARGRTEPDLEAGRAPSAATVLAGRGAIDGERYVELVRPEQEADDWLLARGRIEGRLETRPVPGSRRCEGAKLAASGKQLAVACVPPPSGGVATVELLRSADGGTAWSEVPGLRFETPGLESVSLAVAPDGAVLLAGVCRAGREGSCKPAAPVLVRSGIASGRSSPAQGASPPRSTFVSAADLREVALGPVFSGDGRSAYLLGRRTKDGLLALFVSHDSGESFSARPLDPPGSGRSARASVDADDPPSARDGEPEGGSSDEFDVGEGATLHAGEDGTVGMTLLRPRGSVYVTTTEDGRLLEVAYPDSDGATVAGFGRRVLAIAPVRAKGAEDSEIDLRESLDGGTTWVRVAHTPALAHEFLRGSSSLACGAGGCVFGDTVSRVGWGGHSEPEAPTASAPAAATGRRAAAARTPIVCEPTPRSRWTRIDHVHGGAGIAGGPMLQQLGRGRWLWSLLQYDRSSGEIAMVGAVLPDGDGGEARVTKRVLFGKVPDDKRVAIDVSPQMEGYAAARVQLPGGAKGEPKAGAPMRDVEIAWENLIEGTSARATIADAGAFEPGDVRADPVRDVYEPALVSVSPKGIYFRPHHAQARSAQMYFVDASGRIETLAYPTWPDKGLAGELSVRSEAAHVDGRHLAVAEVQPERGGGTPLAWLVARRDGSSWVTLATSLVPPQTTGRLLTSQVEWTYSGRGIGVTTLMVEAASSKAWAQFHGFGADGTFAPPVDLPTLLDVADRPRACTAADRAGTPRFPAPPLRAEAGSSGSHVVLLLDGKPEGKAKGIAKRRPATGDGGKADADGPEPSFLSTSGMILHGTPASPCVAAWEVTEKDARAAAVLSGDLSRAFAFRRVEPAKPRESQPSLRPEPKAPQLSLRSAALPTSVEYRAMTCRFDTGVVVPDKAP